MRVVLIVTALLAACSRSGPTGGNAASIPAQSTTPVSATTAPCERTTARDPSGVVTANAELGLLGDSFAPSSAAAYDELLIVRRGASLGDRLSLVFRNVGPSAPADWVSYEVVASAQPNPWGDVVFRAGWKPIGFARSCWRIVANGIDSRLVLEVGP